MNRRRFLKTTSKFIFTGSIFVPAMGILRPSEAGLWPYLASFGGSSWATWPETTQAGWGDSDNTFICLFDDTTIGNNEEGEGGGRTNPDTIFTQVGNVAGATGSPPRRLLVAASGQHFVFTDGLSDLIEGQSEFTLIIKLNGLANHHAANDDYILNYKDSGANLWDIYRDATTEGIQFGQGGTTASAPGTTGDLYIIMARPPSGNTWGGWATTKPETKSDIPAAQISDFGSAKSPSAGAASQMDIGAYSDGSQAIDASLYYFILSKKYFL